MTKQLPVEIIKVHEPWAIAELADGSIVKAKIVFISTSLAVDENNTAVLNDQGKKQYLAGTQLIVQTIEAADVKLLKNQRN